MPVPKQSENDTRLTLLEHIAAISSSPDEPSSLFGRILDEIVYAFDSDASWIQLIDPVTNQSAIAAHRGFTARMVSEMNSLQTDKRWINTIVLSKNPVIFAEISEEPYFPFRSSFPENLHSFIAVSIKSGGAATGVLGVLSRTPNRFRLEDARLLSVAGAFVSAVADRMAVHYQDSRKQHNQLISILGEREEFLDALSHELQTPLTALTASAGLLAEELSKEPKASTGRLIRNILQSSSSLKDRVNELLDLSREHAAGYDVEPSSLDATLIFRKVIDELTPMAKAKKQSLTIDIPKVPIMINADGRRLEQIVLNLLSNAIKFTPQNGTITFRAREEKRNLVVRVEDTGSGIPKEEQAKLFRPYYRIPGDRYRYSGLGLGLAITKQLVELHNGKIWVESEQGNGTTFIFSIPLNYTIP
ncbi:MAG TPA: hypothetical protein DCX22_00220 [Dehalococcoidia bacterium]|nr:hypothetical protein [Dehalococcoidia bacterium]